MRGRARGRERVSRCPQRRRRRCVGFSVVLAIGEGDDRHRDRRLAVPREGREEAPNTAGEVNGGLERAAGWLSGAAAAAERPTALPFPPEAFQATLDDTVDGGADARASAWQV